MILDINGKEFPRLPPQRTYITSRVFQVTPESFESRMGKYNARHKWLKIFFSKPKLKIWET